MAGAGGTVKRGGSVMTRGVPVLDPKVHLVGATPEKLARALLRPVKPLRTRRVGKSVVGDEAATEQPAADEAGNRVPHLDEGV